MFLWNRWKFLLNLLLPTLIPMNSEQFEQLSDDQKLSKLCSNAGLKTVERGQYFITFDAEGPSEMVHSKWNQKCFGKPGATPWITEFLVHLFPQLNLQDTHRKDYVKKVDRKVREPQRILPSRFKQTKEINEFSKKSQDLMADVNNTEIFELCETSSKQQCPDCNVYWEAGIVWCTCGRCLRISRSEKEVDKSNNDVVSIPDNVIKKNLQARGQPMCSKAQEMLQKAVKINMDIHSCEMAQRLQVQTLVDTHWMEWAGHHAIWQKCLGNHSHVATKAERLRNSEHWILTLKQEGAQQPLHQRLDFAQAKRECKRLHDEYLARTQQEYRTIPRSQQVRQKRTSVRRNFEEYDCAVVR